MNRFSIQTLLAHRIIRHILYWIGLTMFFGVAWGTYDHDYHRSFSIQAFGLPARLILVYITLYVLIPRFFVTKKFLTFSITYFVLLLLVGIGIQRPIIYFYVEPMYFPTWHSAGYFTITELVNTLLDINNAAVFPVGFSFFKFYFQSQQQALTLEKNNLQAELDQLRNQIQPHFLFNTLNNLYSLIIKKSETAETAVIKLSQLMRYMLYEANKPQVPLSKEIDYLQNYITLEKLRFEENIDISLHIESDKEYQLAPFLLIPLVENAFKHGSAGKNSWIVINLIVREGKLLLHVENSLPNTIKKSLGGIGLINVKKRLVLLYPSSHSIQIQHNDLSYEVVLKINLISQ